MKKFWIIFLILVTLSVNGEEKNKRIVYLGVTENVNNDVINSITFVIDSCFDFGVEVLPNVCFDNTLKSDIDTVYDGSKIINKFRTWSGMIIVTNECISVKNNGNLMLVSGWADYCGNMTLITTYKIDRTESKVLFHSRVKKLIVHEISHNIGLGHCKNSVCIMNLESKLDDQHLWFCSDCQKVLYEKLNPRQMSRGSN